MAFSILVLGVTNKLNENNQVIGKTAFIGISQDGGTEYHYIIQQASWANASLATIKTDLNADAANLYTLAQANGRVVDLFNDVSAGRLVQAAAAANRDRFNDFRAAALNATSLANFQTRVTNAFPTPISAVMDRDYLRAWLDTDPGT